MHKTAEIDYYELLQISRNAEPATIQRVFRILAQRFHPDNQETGDADRFRLLHEAYQNLSNPEKRARYDASLARIPEQWRPSVDVTWTTDDFEFEQFTRLAMLEILYARRRTEPRDPGLYDVELEQLLGTPREHLEFTAWYLIERRYIRRATDSSRLSITAEGVEYLEQNLHLCARRRLKAAAEAHCSSGPDDSVVAS